MYNRQEIHFLFVEQLALLQIVHLDPVVETAGEQVPPTRTDSDLTDRRLLLGVAHGDRVSRQAVQLRSADLGPDHCLLAVPGNVQASDHFVVFGDTTLALSRFQLC